MSEETKVPQDQQTPETQQQPETQAGQESPKEPETHSSKKEKKKKVGEPSWRPHRPRPRPQKTVCSGLPLNMITTASGPPLKRMPVSMTGFPLRLPRFWRFWTLWTWPPMPLVQMKATRRA